MVYFIDNVFLINKLVSYNKLFIESCLMRGKAMLNKKKSINIKEILKNHTRLNYDILDGMVDWVRVIDKNGIIIYANKPMQEELGENIIGELCYSLLGKSCFCKDCITKTTITTGRITKKEEKIGDRVFSVKSSPVRDQNGDIYAGVEVFREVTKERKLENELRNKNTKMSQDLNFAKVLQNKILPAKGQYDDCNIDYIYKPSEMLSGDIFDVFFIDDNYLGIYISDVAGHGVTASMMTMFIRQTMRAIKDDIINPSKALSQLHQKFLDLNLDDDKYFSIFYGVLDKRDNTFRFVNGGHNSVPVLLRKDKYELLMVTGYPISYLFNKVEYEDRVIKLFKGDKIIFYTDGIIEAKNKDNEEFGIDRLIHTIKSSKDNLIKDIEKAVFEFEYHDNEDDYAVLTIEVLK